MHNSPAEASEAAAAQGRFWELYALLFTHQRALQRRDHLAYAERIGLDLERFTRELDGPAYEETVRLQAEGGAQARARSPAARSPDHAPWPGL
jgi:predicted DsbA family dithiol-disulfide isomerase